MRSGGVVSVLYAVCAVCVSSCGHQSESGADAAGEESAAAKIAVGAEVPEFTLASLESPEVTHSRSDLSGKVYLIDFWATWCAPCVAELPNLHRAYDAYADRGFEILSVAMNDNREQIARLRETDWAMPWLHAFEPLDSDVAELFELFGLPMAILVDRNNNIVAIDEDARGEPLQEALALLLGDVE